VTFSPKSDIHSGDNRRQAGKPVEYIPTNSSFPRENDVESDDFGPERGPLSASRRRKGGLHGDTLSNYADKAAVYEEPIGQLAEQVPPTGHERDIDHTRKTSDSTPTAAVTRSRLYDVTAGTNRNIHISQLAADTTTYSPPPATSSSVKQSLALFHPVGEHNGFVDSGYTNRRAGDSGQLKSGPVDDNAWEEMIQRDPPSSIFSISPSSSGYATDWIPTAIALPTVASAVGTATHDVKPNLPAAVMSSAPHVTSSSCVAVDTAKWAATALTTLLTLAISNP